MSTSRIFWCGVCLAGLATYAVLWASYHFGWTSKLPWYLGLGISVIPAITQGLVWSLPESMVERLRDCVRRQLEKKMSWPTVGSFALAVTVLTLSVSSITVIPGPAKPAEPVVVRITPVGGVEGEELQLPHDGSALHVVRWTTPFGRSIRMAPSGMIPRTLNLLPLVGLEVDLERDFRRSPMVLVRVPPGVVMQGEGATMTVNLSEQNQLKPISSGSGTARAFLLSTGPGLLDSSARLDVWRMDLLAESVEADEVAHRLKAWMSPSKLPNVSTDSLQPGTILQAQLTNGAGIVVASSQFELPNERLVDVLMTEPAKQ